MHSCGHIPCTADTGSGGCYSLSVVPACFSLVDHPDNYVGIKPLKRCNQFAASINLGALNVPRIDWTALFERLS